MDDWVDGWMDQQILHLISAGPFFKYFLSFVLNFETWGQSPRIYKKDVFTKDILQKRHNSLY